MTDVDTLERAVLSLDARAEGLGAAATFAEGRVLFGYLDDARPFPARAVSRLSRIMARAARWSRQDPDAWVSMALDAAKESNDGPLLAGCWLAQATSLGVQSMVLGVGAGALMRGLLDAAVVKAGPDHGVKASALYRLAFEQAAVGHRADALTALTRADVAAEAAGWSDGERGGFAGTALWALDDLREAEFALSDGVGCPRRRLASICDLARVHLDDGSPDAALEDILQAAHNARALSRLDALHRLRPTASNLPQPLRTIALQHLN